MISATFCCDGEVALSQVRLYHRELNALKFKIGETEKQLRIQIQAQDQVVVTNAGLFPNIIDIQATIHDGDGHDVDPALQS